MLQDTGAFLKASRMSPAGSGTVHASLVRRGASMNQAATALTRNAPAASLGANVEGVESDSNAGA
jgi:hypothetical protein